MAKIKKVIAHEILDSRGIPTVESTVILADGAHGTFSVPAGASIGKYEAYVLVDNDQKRYQGLGKLKSLENIANVLSGAILGLDSQDQEKIDKILIDTDASENKSNLGANTLLSLSGAVLKAQADSENLPIYQYVAKLSHSDTAQFQIPTPMFNILNGGKHGGGNLDFQEFMVVPPKAFSYSKNLQFGVESYYSLKESIKTHGGITLLGDEGGYAPSLYSNLDAFKILKEAISRAGYNVGVDSFLGVDCAASNFKQGSAYRIKDRPVPLTPNDLLDFYLTLVEQFHLIAIEDPFDEDEWSQWTSLCQKLGTESLIVADDLTATNKTRLEKVVSQKAANSVIVKPNQIGTIWETLEFIKLAKKSNFKIIVSHRSGETNDNFIADFAVGVGADYVKFGAPARGERVAKYNRLLEIEHELS